MAELKFLNQVLIAFKYILKPYVRSSRSQMFFRIGVLIEMRLQRKCFAVNIAKFLKQHFFKFFFIETRAVGASIMFRNKFRAKRLS